MDMMKDLMEMAARMGISEAEILRAHQDPAYEKVVMERIRTANQPKSEQSFADIKHFMELKRNTMHIPRPKQTRQELTRRMEEDLKMARLPPQYAKTTAMIGLEKHFSTTPIHKLKRVTLNKTSVTHLHKGQYLLCRIIISPVRLLSLHIGIEDPKGDVQKLMLDNYPGTQNSSEEFLKTLLPVGTILAIREPSMEFENSERPAQIVVRVASPSDVTIVKIGDPLLDGVKWAGEPPTLASKSLPLQNTPEGWKKQGDVLFKKGWHLPASLEYSKCLEADASWVPPRMNRSLASLRFGNYGTAREDCRIVLSMDNSTLADRIKASFRAGQAEYGFKHWVEAKKCYADCLALDPSNVECQQALKNTEKRISESSTGGYDWVGILKQAIASARRIDVADYIGPVRVEALPHRGGGRGVVATRDLELGELLVVSKAFASAFGEDVVHNRHAATTGTNFLTEISSIMYQIRLIPETVEKIASNPCYMKPVLDLYAGPTHDYPPLSYSSSIPEGPVPSQPLQFPSDVNTWRVEGVVSYNSFQFGPIGVMSLDEPRPRNFTKLTTPINTAPEPTQRVALCLFPSMFNHDCDGNVEWLFFGDVMVMRTTRAVSKGTELMIPYVQYCSFAERERELSPWLDKCRCDLCEADRRDGKEMVGKRWSAWDACDKLLKQNNSPSSTIAPIKELILTLQATYRSTRTKPRIEMVMVHMQLAHALHLEGKVLEALKVRFKALECAGIKVLDSSLEGGNLSKSDGKILPIATTRLPVFLFSEASLMICLANAAEFKNGLNDPIRAEKWLRALWWIEEKSIGGNAEMFEIRFAKILAEPRILLSDFNKAVRASDVLG